MIKVLKRRMACSISWQWYPKKKVEVIALPDYGGYNPVIWDNRKMIKEFGQVLAEADVVVGHNVDEFDDKMVNTDIFLNHLPVPPPHRTIDTLKVLRGRFRLNSNKLGDVCEELGIGKKLPHQGFATWEGCMNGDPKAWDTMRRYNKHDVSPLLRGLYEFERPWIRNHPNMAVGLSMRCPTCKHPELSSDGWRYTQSLAYIRMICHACRSRCKKVPKGKGWVYLP